MIVHDLNVLCARSRPAEAHTELIVYTDTVLPGAVTLERFQPVVRRHPEVFQPARRVKRVELNRPACACLPVPTCLRAARRQARQTGRTQTGGLAAMEILSDLGDGRKRLPTAGRGRVWGGQGTAEGGREQCTPAKGRERGTGGTGRRRSG